MKILIDISSWLLFFTSVIYKKKKIIIIIKIFDFSMEPWDIPQTSVPRIDNETNHGSRI